MSQEQHDEVAKTQEPGGPQQAPAAHAPIDPWETLSAAEEDLDGKAAVATKPAPVELLNADPGEVVDPDAMAQFHADANAAAVEAAVVVQAADPANDPAAALIEAKRRSGGGLFTLPLICLGIGILAACVLVPQIDANRRLAYERLKLRNDLQSVEKQVETNDQFLKMVAHDSNLAERLAQRQMKIIRKGTEVLNLKSDGDAEMSPYQLTAIPTPAEMPPYVPQGGPLAQMCYNPKSRLYLMGVGLLAVAVGLVVGAAPRSRD